MQLEPDAPGTDQAWRLIAENATLTVLTSTIYDVQTNRFTGKGARASGDNACRHSASLNPPYII